MLLCRMENNSIGIQIRKARLQRKYTQTQLGEIVDVTTANMSLIENGANATIKTVSKIAKELKTDLIIKK